MPDLENPKAQQALVSHEESSWDGHFLACCGSPCTLRGWGVCCLTMWLPCVTHGLNLRYMYTAQKACLGVLLFLALCYLLPCIVFPAVWFNAFHAPDVVACEVDLINVQPAQGPVDLDFTHKLLACQRPGWIKVWVCVASMWLCSFSLVVYLLIVRMKTRQRLAIPSAQNGCVRFLKDCCIMFWCTTCAMCQENRTLHKKYREVPMAPHYQAPLTAPAPSKMDV